MAHFFLEIKIETRSKNVQEYVVWWIEKKNEIIEDNYRNAIFLLFV